MVVQAVKARFLPGAQVAHLEQVRTQLEASEGKAGFSMSCDHGELRTDTNDFHATGNVRGTTGDGRHFATEWVRYDHKTGVAWTDAPVLVEEVGGTYRGGGFRYQVREQRFRFVGGASLVRE
jgi:LPS export ABC transporter protein LptC